MQHLIFHPAWDKTLCYEDRKLIEQLFVQQLNDQPNMLSASLIRTAINYKNGLLVTALVHNYSEKTIHFIDRIITLECEESEIKQTFTLPELQIPAKSSMPWTFIFERQQNNFNSIVKAIHFNTY